MKYIVANIVIALIFGSPLWISFLVFFLAPRSLALASVLCAFQLIIAYAIWWFFWGGGIGGEAHLSELWQIALLAAALPELSAIISRKRKKHAEQGVPGYRRQSAPQPER